MELIPCTEHTWFITRHTLWRIHQPNIWSECNDVDWISHLAMLGIKESTNLLGFICLNFYKWIIVLFVRNSRDKNTAFCEWIEKKDFENARKDRKWIILNQWIKNENCRKSKKDYKIAMRINHSKSYHSSLLNHLYWTVLFECPVDFFRRHKSCRLT